MFPPVTRGNPAGTDQSSGSLSLTATTTLPPTPRSARIARSFVISKLHEWHRDELADTAELLTSELVTNAVVHAKTAMRLDVRANDDGVVVAVEDSGEGVPAVYDANPRDLGGRGLMLVAELSQDWGVEPRSGHKRVWFRLG